MICWIGPPKKKNWEEKNQNLPENLSTNTRKCQAKMKKNYRSLYYLCFKWGLPIYHTAAIFSSCPEGSMVWLASGLSSFSVFRSCTNASFYITEKCPLLLNIDLYKDGCCLKYFLSKQLSLFLNCVCVVWTLMMHVLTFILQHLNVMILKSFMMTPYTSQAVGSPGHLKDTWS